MAWEFINAKSQVKGEILIGLPHREAFSDKFLAAVLGVQYPEMFAHSLYMESGLPLDISRNVAVSHALQRKVSHILFLDADILLQRDTITLLHRAALPIVSAVYYGRNPPHNVVANISGKPLTRNNIEEKRNSTPNGQALMEVHDTGMGCVLIDMRVFERIATVHNLEWYCMMRHPDQLANIEKDDTGLTYTNEEAIALNYACKYCGNTLIAKFFEYRIGKYAEDSLSEDYYFCKLARKCGFSLYLAIHAEVPHEIKTYTIDSKGLTNSVTSAGVV
jgi:hypothetical protein